MDLTIIRISIRKSLVTGARPYRQSAANSFSNDYLVQTQATLGSAQLAIYAANIAGVESRLYPSFVRFDGAHIKLSKPGASSEELRGEFSSVDLPGLRGQHPASESDGPAYPPVCAVYARNASGGRGGRLALSYAVTAMEWVLYTRQGLLPLRFQQPLSPVPSVSQQLIEAINAAGGTYIMPWGAGENAPAIRRISEFVFTGLQLASKPKRRNGPQTKLRAALHRAALQAIKDGTEFDPDAVIAASKVKGKIKAPVAGIVYLLRAGPHYKIGKSTNFDKRLNQIKLQLPHAVEVVHVIRAADHSRAESHWHRRFAARRLNGEWFELTEAEVAEFKSVSEM